MFTYNYDQTELETTDHGSLRRRLLRDYPNDEFMINGPDGEGVVRIIIDVNVDREDLLTVLNDPEPYVILDVDNLSLVNDGIATGQVTVTYSDPSNAAGLSVDAIFTGLLQIDACSKPFDGSGQATFTFGPFPPNAGITCQPMRIPFSVSDIVAPVFLNFEVTNS